MMILDVYVFCWIICCVVYLYYLMMVYLMMIYLMVYLDAGCFFGLSPKCTIVLRPIYFPSVHTYTVHTYSHKSQLKSIKASKTHTLYTHTHIHTHTHTYVYIYIYIYIVYMHTYHPHIYTHAIHAYAYVYSHSILFDLSCLLIILVVSWSILVLLSLMQNLSPSLISP